MNKSNPSPEGPPLFVAVGASAGGVEALLRLASELPADFPGVVCMVLHIGPHHSILPELLRGRARRPAMHPRDGQRALPGTIYVAPPDHHLLLEGDVLRLSRSARENLARPAIDPLFRSAAVHWRERAVGVVLTGCLDDGAAGLAAIKEAGGIAVVQDPDDAPEREMPLAALAATQVDACLPLAEVAPYLQRLAETRRPAATAPMPERLGRELAINQGADSMEHLGHIADTSNLTCPDCGGALWEVREQNVLRYRCHTGHAFGAASLAYGQGQVANQQLWGGLRALRERAMLLRRMATVARGMDDPDQAAVIQSQVAEVERQAANVEELLHSESSAALGGA